VIELAIRIVVNAIALYVVVQVVPQVVFDYGDEWWKLGAVAIVFGLVNALLRPIVKALSLPISLLTLGLVGFVINAAMLLVTAFLSGQFDLGFTVGGFPPDFTADTVVGALIASVIISAVSTALGLLNFGRRIVT
jgi:putative membrane protein